MSNHYLNAKLRPRKSKVSVALAINHGLGGPKPMAKAEGDGKQVNIPALPRKRDGGTKEIRTRGLMVFTFFARSVLRLANPSECF